MKVQIRPLPSVKWHGKTGNESFTRPKIIQALVDPDSMTYSTGLSEEEEKELGAKLKVDLSKQFLMTHLIPSGIPKWGEWHWKTEP